MAEKRHAFPTLGDQHPGLSRRQWFAGQALAGGLEQGTRDSMDMHYWHEPKAIARRAYEIADAMLREEP